jgi:hypothetical protein
MSTASNEENTRRLAWAGRSRLSAFRHAANEIPFFPLRLSPSERAGAGFSPQFVYVRSRLPFLRVAQLSLPISLLPSLARLNRSRSRSHSAAAAVAAAVAAAAAAAAAAAKFALTIARRAAVRQ